MDRVLAWALAIGGFFRRQCFGCNHQLRLQLYPHRFQLKRSLWLSLPDRLGPGCECQLSPDHLATAFAEIYVKDFYRQQFHWVNTYSANKKQ